jgi:hypothetical protein
MVNTAILYGEFDYDFYIKYNGFIDDHIIFLNYNKYDTKTDYTEITKELDYKKVFV